jgi:Tol biopolymer transport system component
MKRPVDSMRRYIPWHTCLLLVLVTLLLQGCLGIGNTSSSQQSFKSVNTGNGQTLQVNNQALFKGTIYFTQGNVLLAMDGSRNVHTLTPSNEYVTDPSVSPDGKTLAFIVRYKFYSDLVDMPVNGKSWTVLRTGLGHYIPNPPYPAPKSTHKWYFQPSWEDNTHLLFLSDFEKLTVYPGIDAQLLDLQVFSISKNNPGNAQEVAYAAFGDGGNRDPIYRPKHSNQVAFTRYAYDTSQTQQVIQIFLIDANGIVNHPYAGFRPGVNEFDPAVALTPPTTSVQNLMPNFSPDGNQLAYIRRIDASHTGLYVMPVAENITRFPITATEQKNALQPYAKSSLIVEGQYVSQPVWSPDGTQIAYMSYSNNEFDIWLANVAVDAKTGAYILKGSPMPLTNGGVDASSRPAWTN